MNSCYFYVADLCTVLACSLLKPEAWLPSTCLINFQRMKKKNKSAQFSHCFWLCILFLPSFEQNWKRFYFIFVFFIFSLFAKTLLLHCWMLNSVKIQDQVYAIVINWLIHTKCAQLQFSLSPLWLVLLVNAIQHLIFPARLSTVYGSNRTHITRKISRWTFCWKVICKYLWLLFLHLSPCTLVLTCASYRKNCVY